MLSMTHAAAGDDYIYLGDAFSIQPRAYAEGVGWKFWNVGQDGGWTQLRIYVQSVLINPPEEEESGPGSSDAPLFGGL